MANDTRQADRPGPAPHGTATRTVVLQGGDTFVVGSGRFEWVWRDIATGDWEPETLELYDRLLTPDTTYVDVGAWIGPTVLFAARRAGRVLAYEPDPVAYEELVANLRLNPDIGNVSVYNVAIAPRAGRVRLGNRRVSGDSTSSVLFADEQVHWNVDSRRLDRELSDETPPFFVKVDIEGGEYELIPGLRWLLRRTDTILYLSVHPSFLMASLGHRYPGASLAARIRRRTAFLAVHLRLAAVLARLPYIYDPRGRPIRLLPWLASVAWRGGRFEERTLVLMHRPWPVHEGPA